MNFTFHTQGLINPCAAVVDYEFYIPTGQTAIDLYNAAKIKLDNGLVLYLNVFLFLFH